MNGYIASALMGLSALIVGWILIKQAERAEQRDKSDQHR